MNKTAFLTTIYPMNENYLNDFFESLENQVFKDFDLIVVNDGYKEFEELTARYKNLNIYELKKSFTVSKNREYGINYAIEKGYEFLIFGDCDDYFSENRIEKTLELLENNDIVINDLCLFDNERIIENKYISNRLNNRDLIDIDFIKDKNIFGFSNTAIRLSCLDNKVVFDESIIAVDWYFYSTLLQIGFNAIFTNETITFYRQYEDNIIGLGKLTVAIIEKGINIKLKHYSLLNYNSSYRKIEKLKEKSEKELFEDLTNNRINKPFWWEEIRYINI